MNMYIVYEYVYTDTCPSLCMDVKYISRIGKGILYSGCFP